MRCGTALVAGTHGDEAAAGAAAAAMGGVFAAPASYASAPAIGRRSVGTLRRLVEAGAMGVRPVTVTEGRRPPVTAVRAVMGAVTAAGGVDAAGAMADWLPHPPRNRRRGRQLATELSKLDATRPWLERIESAVSQAAYVPSTWERRERVRREVAWVSAQWPTMSRNQVMRRWASMKLCCVVPTAFATLWDTARAIFPWMKTDQQLKQFELGVAKLWGRRAWYPQGPVLTRTLASRLVYCAETWCAVRIDLCWALFARDADVSDLTAGDVRWVGGARFEVDLDFLKNDAAGEFATKKEVSLMRPRAFREYAERFAADRILFPQGYRPVLAEIRRVLGPEYGTRAIRRGAARVATAAGASRIAVQTALAHRNIHQQRVYTNMLNKEEKRLMRGAQRALRRPASVAAGRRTTSRASTVTRRPPPRTTRSRSRAATERRRAAQPGVQLLPTAVVAGAALVSAVPSGGANAAAGRLKKRQQDDGAALAAATAAAALQPGARSTGMETETDVE